MSPDAAAIFAAQPGNLTEWPLLQNANVASRSTRTAIHPNVRWPRSRYVRYARAGLALWPAGAAKRERLRKETVLCFRSAIMPVLPEVAPYDFRT